jgi:RNA polymerase sigma-70 factor (ECF subfamily)
MNKAEFADIYEEFFPRLYTYIFHRVNDSIVAEDLVSQTFFKALRNLKKYDSEKGQISTWLYTIASNLLIDHYRQDETIESIDEEHEESIATEGNLSHDMDFE